MVAGVPVVLEVNHAWRAFPDHERGLEWLARDDARAAYREVLALVEASQAAAKVLIALRDFLLANPRAASLDDVSRALALSTRSRQRQLQQSGSSFRHELRRARVQAAARLLDGSDLKLEAIAAEVGYASISHFTDAFVEEMGEPPLAYRRARRSG